MEGKDLYLGVRHIVLAALFIGPEEELFKAELGEEPLSNGFSVVYGHFFVHDYAGSRVVGHEP